MRLIPTLLFAVLLAAQQALALQPAPEGETGRGELIEFTYAWPAVVEQVPGLRKHLGERMGAERLAATKEARADLQARIEDKIPFNHHAYHKAWKAAAEGSRLLSLSAETYTFQGGAHGMTVHDALIWDKQADKAVERDAVLPAALLASVAACYCDALDAERAERRGEPVPKNREGMFNTCPPLGEQTVAPVDEDANGRFDGLGILLDPYEAGPYAEGSYELEVGIDAAALAALPAEYRSAFEIRR